jgi:hypothetical protein
MSHTEIQRAIDLLKSKTEQAETALGREIQDIANNLARDAELMKTQLEVSMTALHELHDQFMERWENLRQVHLGNCITILDRQAQLVNLTLKLIPAMDIEHGMPELNDGILESPPASYLEDFSKTGMLAGAGIDLNGKRGQRKAAVAALPQG